jgi:uncharacterized small protein (DUF1192 family)
MDSDDLLPNKIKQAGVEALSRQDITSLSIGDLQERIALLEAEILRCREAITARQATHAAAAAIFGKPGTKSK